jgi:hypothetical protein
VSACYRDIGVCLMQLHISHDDAGKGLQTSHLHASCYGCVPETRGRYVESTALILFVLRNERLDIIICTSFILRKV